MDMPTERKYTTILEDTIVIRTQGWKSDCRAQNTLDQQSQPLKE
jgi:hypothetical protein